MGRPLAKKHFGNGTGDQIKVRAKIGGNAEGNGLILRQRTTNSYQVTVAGNTGVCTLVDKANGALAAGEMTISVVNDASASVRVRKLLSRVAKLYDGTVSGWTYTTSLIDAKVDMPEATDLAFTLQPVDRTGIGGTATTFTVTATATPSETILYQWQVQTGGTGAWANVTNTGTYTTATTTTLNIANGTTAGIGNKYRCVISSDTGGSLTSSSATLVS